MSMSIIDRGCVALAPKILSEYEGNTNKYAAENAPAYPLARLGMAVRVYRYFVLERGWPVEELHNYPIYILNDLSRPGELRTIRLPGGLEFSNSLKDGELKAELSHLRRIGKRKAQIAYLADRIGQEIDLTEALQRRTFDLSNREWGEIERIVGNMGLTVSPEAPHRRNAPRVRGKALLALAREVSKLKL
jgi:hypothetical protein